MILIWIIVAIVLFWVIVLVHELWHFSTARIFWVKVEEFWLGIPPRAKKLFIDKKWTLYSLNWLPIGGFVRLTWELPNTFRVYDKNKKLYNNIDLENDINNWIDIFDSDGDIINNKDKKLILEKIKENKAEYNLMNKKSWQQAIIILAWVFMNFLLAIVIFSYLFFVWIKPIWINDKIETNLDLKLIPTYEQAIKSWLIIKNEWLAIFPLKDSIAEKSWLKDLDIILWVINEKWETIITNETKRLIDIIWNSTNKEITFIVNREWKKINIKIIPQLKQADNSNKWKIWASIWDNIMINKNFEYKYWFLESIKYWTIETYNQALLTFKWIWLLFNNIFFPETPKIRQDAIESMNWPIWIVNIISNSLSAWIKFIFIFWAIISINLWVFNLLPIPALDWWRFFFITINGLIKKIIWKKAISETTESIIHLWFFIILIALSLIIAYNDINKIISQ